MPLTRSTPCVFASGKDPRNPSTFHQSFFTLFDVYPSDWFETQTVPVSSPDVVLDFTVSQAILDFLYPNAFALLAEKLGSSESGK